MHPFLEEKVEWGLVPFVQAMLLARYLRGDLEEYPPFLWMELVGEYEKWKENGCLF